jgi:putative tryptophan/tyrosine transport system substrate-binding protein
LKSRSAAPRAERAIFEDAEGAGIADSLPTRAGMKRREFIILLGGVAAWPLDAHAQPHERMRRIGVLTSFDESDPDAKARILAFEDGLRKLGWTDGHNLHIEHRWAPDPERLRTDAVELVKMQPEVIFAAGAVALSALQSATRRVPIVFAQVPEPVEFGYVESLARPGGNTTGFGLWDKALVEKRLELLKDIAPRVTRVAFVYDPANPVALRQLAAMEAAAATLGVQLAGAPVRGTEEIERVFDEVARESSSGLILLPSPIVNSQLDLIIALAARYRLPAIFPYRFFVTRGGLASYGVELLDHYRGAAFYVDRILRGAKPADLPVQLPTKFLLVINVKTAKALGLTISESFLQHADELIE